MLIIVVSGFCIMSGKRKGGVEKVREKKKLLLLNVSEKCFKINDMFSKKVNPTSTSSALKSITTVGSEIDDKTNVIETLSKTVNEVTDLITTKKK